MINYDVAMIGTSPLAMLEAISCSINGQTVIMFDKEDTIGGAWKTTDLKTRTRVDIGPHYISVWLESYKLLNHMGFEMNLLTPREEWRLEQPFFGLKSVTYDRQWILKVVKDFHTRPFIGKAKALCHFGISGIKAGINRAQNRRVLIYPKDGMGGMMQHFETLLKHFNITVKLQTNIQKIVYGTRSKSFDIADKNGNIFHASNLIMTSFSDIEEIKIDNEVQAQPSAKIVDLLELQLIVQDGNALEFSAIKFTKHKYIADYVTDITHSTRTKTNDPYHRVLAVRMDDASAPQTHESVEKIIAHFQHHGLLSEEAKIVEYNWYLSSRPFRDIENWKDFCDKTHGNLELQYTGSMGVGLKRKMKSWRGCLARYDFVDNLNHKNAA